MHCPIAPACKRAVKRAALSPLAALPTAAHPCDRRTSHQPATMTHPQQLNEHSEARPPRPGHVAPAISSHSRASSLVLLGYEKALPVLARAVAALDGVEAALEEGAVGADDEEGVAARRAEGAEVLGEVLLGAWQGYG